MNKKLLISFSILGIAAVIAIGATVAYFSNTETSKGNTFTAGTIDLKVGDANIVVNGPENNVSAWEPKDLTELNKFFDFSDLKPGDNGSDTIKIKVGTNPAWVCGEINNIVSTEETLTDPENKIQDTMDKGELDDELYITFYRDFDCNGKKDGNDSTIVSWTLLKNVGKFALADSLNGTAFQPDVENCISKMWCFGSVNTETGACDGSTVTNKSQSDKLVADIVFEAIQSRHNDNFVCVQPPQSLQ